MDIELRHYEKEMSLETILERVKDKRLRNVTIEFQMEMNHGTGNEELIYKVRADVDSNIVREALGL